jgi:hypothetical protein
MVKHNIDFGQKNLRFYASFSKSVVIIGSQNHSFWNFSGA